MKHRHRKRRLRRIAKWAGVVVSSILLGVTVASCFFVVDYRTGGGSHNRRSIGVFAGSILFFRAPFLSNVPGWDGVWHFDLRRPDWRPLEFGWKVSGNGYWIVLPLWVPFSIVALPTAWLWWRDHRRRPGHCRKCGYDLTGLTGGRCPECGTELDRRMPT